MNITAEQAVQWIVDKTKLPRNVASALDRSVVLDEATGLVRLDVTQAGKILDAEQARFQGLVDDLWGPPMAPTTPTKGGTK